MQKKICAARKTDGSGDTAATHGPIIEDETGVRKEPYSLPQGFSWDTLDLGDAGVVSSLQLQKLRARLSNSGMLEVRKYSSRGGKKLNPRKINHAVPTFISARGVMHSTK